MPEDRVKKLVRRLGTLCLPLARLRSAAPRVQETWVRVPGGRSVYCHIHRPRVPGRYPGVVIVPGGMSPGTDYDRARELTADDVAAQGCVVLHYDPSGRGKTGGEEDRWGPAHQREFARVVEFFARHPDLELAGIGVLSFSIGITIASAALAKFPLPVRYLFDWEGPSNRHNITRDDTFEPFREYPTTDEAFWAEREAARFIGRLPCGYFRYQAEVDHMQGRYKGHALELLGAAARGTAAWTRCNDNPPDTVFDARRPEDCRWVPEKNNTKAQILAYLRAVQSHVQDRQ